MVLLCPVVVSVWAGAFTPNGTQPPLATPILTPGDCSGCHGNFNPNANIEPYPTWSGSMMANAARDPLFWAALDVANHDVAGAGDFCLRCHVPAGWLAGRSEPPVGSVDGCNMQGVIDEPDNDFEGVSCHFCHRMMVNPSPPGGQQSVYFENGQYWIDDGDCSFVGSGPCRRGPYDYAGVGEIEPPHQWQYSAYHDGNSSTQRSYICGNCHNVTSPAETLINSSGVDTGVPFPVERTFKEWQQSVYSQPGPNLESCQQCHMPDATESPVYACAFEENDRTGNLAIHRFVGGNAWIPGVLRDQYPNLGRTAAYNATITAATDMLQNQAASIAVTGDTVIVPGEPLDINVRVTNLTGHKLPTGYTEGRRMWIQVQVKNALTQVIWESGAYNAATGVLTLDPQIKIYRSERGVWNRNGTNQCDVTDGGGNHIFHFVLDNCIKVDNRIPPLGFTGGTNLETQPVAYSYPETSPGSGQLVNYDDTAYQIPIPPLTRGPLTVTARLYYQTASKEYVEFLRDEAVANNFPDDCIDRTAGTPALSRGEILYQMWTASGRGAPVTMVLASQAVTLDNDIFLDGFEGGSTSAWTITVP